MNVTASTTSLVANLSSLAPPPPCLLNLTSFDSNQTLIFHNGTSACNSSLSEHLDGDEAGKGDKKSGAKTVKVLHMQPKAIDTGNRLYLSYDPMNGVQTASILGSCLLLVILYILYKAKCRKKQWTSEDQLYLEKYRRRTQDRYRKNNHSHASSRWSMAKDSVKEAIAMENTAKWIQSQPLNTAIPKRTLKTMSNMCNICIDSCQSGSCPLCSNSDIQVSSSPGDMSHSMFAADSGRHPGRKSKRRVDKALLEVCHLHLPALRPNHNDTRLIENDIHEEHRSSKWKKNMGRKGQKSRKSKNSNLEQDNISLSPAPTKKCKNSGDSVFHFDIERQDQVAPKNLDAKATNAFREPSLYGSDSHHDSSNSVHVLGLPPRHEFNHSHSQCSSLSDSIDLDKHIEIGIHNTSPRPQRAALLPQLKYLPLFTMPVTNISLASSPKLSPKSPFCELSMSELPSSDSEVPLLLPAAGPLGEAPPFPLLQKLQHSDSGNDVTESSTLPCDNDELKQDGRHDRGSTVDGSTENVKSLSADEGISLKELGQGLKYIDAAEENGEEDGELLSDSVVVTRL